MRYYEVVTMIGVGSMGSVAKVKKRPQAVGGSARPTFVLSESGRNECLHQMAIFARHCCGFEEESTKEDKNALKTFSTEDPSVQSVTAGQVSSMVKYIHQDTYYALKTIDTKKTKTKALLEELKNEVDILKSLDHPHIVRPLEVFYYRNSISIVMELCTGGDLYTRDPYPLAEAQKITAAILSAVAYMHSMNITHRDMKYENVLFTSPKPDADIKIVDFGLRYVAEIVRVVRTSLLPANHYRLPLHSLQQKVCQGPGFARFCRYCLYNEPGVVVGWLHEQIRRLVRRGD
jgi:serine/threonine protein kinase